jgi:hypothetical protein
VAAHACKEPASSCTGCLMQYICSCSDEFENDGCMHMHMKAVSYLVAVHTLKCTMFGN